MKSRSECEDIVDAIRKGGIDALVVSGEQGEQVVVLEDAEHPYRVLVENFSDGAATLDSAGTILYANNRLLEILGLPREELIGVPLVDRIAGDGRDNLARMIRKRTHGEVVLRMAGEPQRAIRFTVSPLKMKSSGEPHICLLARELTDMLKITDSLKSTEQALGEISSRLLSLQDEERRRIARDLHDITGQTLAAQGMMLGSLLESPSELDPQARKIVSECAALNQRITDEVRTLSYLLHPPLIEERGLASAVRSFVEGFSARTGINIDVEVAADFPRLTPETEIALFRTVQESLTNVHRHSGASRGNVTLRHTDTQIILSIRDFGRGMRAEILSSQGSKVSLGVGILGMRERIRQLSGALEIASRHNEGTLVTVHLPLRRSAAHA
jgi:PAS domain S-box-containing protein